MATAEPTVDIEDPAALAKYLRATGRAGPSEQLSIRTLAGGVSNKTVLVEFPDRSGGAAAGWVLKQALPKLRVKVDWFSDPARIRREAEGLRWLARLAPPGTTTPLVFEDAGQNLLAMEAVPQPHENWKAMLLAGRVETGHVDQFAALLGEIHRRAAESAGPLAEAFADRSFFESLRVEPYYLYVAEWVPAAAEFLRDLVADTRRRRLTLVHGDYSPKNVLVYDGRLVLLDHEVIHWGDPAFDVGFALTHLLSKATHLPRFRRRLLDAALRFCQAYAATLGWADWEDALQATAVRHTLGCMLARVAGRSPLEYLDRTERGWQGDFAIGLMKEPPRKMAEFIAHFAVELDAYGYRPARGRQGNPRQPGQADG